MGSRKSHCQHVRFPCLCYGCRWIQGKVERSHVGCPAQHLQFDCQQFLDGKYISFSYFGISLTHDSCILTIHTRILPSTISSRSCQLSVVYYCLSIWDQVLSVSTRRRRSIRSQPIRNHRMTRLNTKSGMSSLTNAYRSTSTTDTPLRP